MNFYIYFLLLFFIIDQSDFWAVQVMKSFSPTFKMSDVNSNIVTITMTIHVCKLNDMRQVFCFVVTDAPQYMRLSPASTIHFPKQSLVLSAVISCYRWFLYLLDTEGLMGGRLAGFIVRRWTCLSSERTFSNPLLIAWKAVLGLAMAGLLGGRPTDIQDPSDTQPF